MRTMDKSSFQPQKIALFSYLASSSAKWIKEIPFWKNDFFLHKRLKQYNVTILIVFYL